MHLRLRKYVKNAPQVNIRIEKFHLMVLMCSKKKMWNLLFKTNDFLAYHFLNKKSEEKSLVFNHTNNVEGLCLSNIYSFILNALYKNCKQTISIKIITILKSQMSRLNIKSSTFAFELNIQYSIFFPLRMSKSKLSIHGNFKLLKSKTHFFGFRLFHIHMTDFHDAFMLWFPHRICYKFYCCCYLIK